jgi:hypothetical protein
MFFARSPEPRIISYLFDCLSKIIRSHLSYSHQHLSHPPELFRLFRSFVEKNMQRFPQDMISFVSDSFFFIQNKKYNKINTVFSGW